jgi:hypothetical protein
VFVFLVSCVRMAFSQVRIGDTANFDRDHRGDTVKVQRGLALRWPSNDRQGDNQREYAIETTGTFPFLRVVPIWRDPLPVPMEGPRTKGISGSTDDSKRPARALTHKSKPGGEDPFCLTAFCSSCFSCGGCSSCSSCNSCNACGSCAC